MALKEKKQEVYENELLDNHNLGYSVFGEEFNCTVLEACFVPLDLYLPKKIPKYIKLEKEKEEKKSFKS